MLSLIKEYLGDLFNVFYPNLCVSCSENLIKGESVLCFRCDEDLPRTNYWKEQDNPLTKRLWGRVHVETALALLNFRKGERVQHLLHHLKYRGRKDIGEHLGNQLAYQIKTHEPFATAPQLIVPVPLHWKKLRTRGYNQCDPFAHALSESLNIPWSSAALERTVPNVSQTKKRRLDRWDNVAEIFAVKDEKQFRDKHILLVDDVVTTGATAESCLHTILKVPGTKASFAAIATALT